jgi:hypothetical protein
MIWLKKCVEQQREDLLAAALAGYQTERDRVQRGAGVTGIGRAV